MSEATCYWRGKLPPKQYKTPLVYSTKVFVGGLPWDITVDDLLKDFGVYGACRVELTNNNNNNASSNKDKSTSLTSFTSPFVSVDESKQQQQQRGKFVLISYSKLNNFFFVFIFIHFFDI